MTAVSSVAMSFSSDVFVLTPTVISAGAGTSYPILANAWRPCPQPVAPLRLLLARIMKKLQITQPNVTLLGLGTDASKSRLYVSQYRKQWRGSGLDDASRSIDISSCIDIGWSRNPLYQRCWEAKLRVG
jgi:hypothetical protein